MSTGTDTKANALAAGALEVDNLRLLEDGSERGGALGSDIVAFETVSEWWGGDGERVGVSMGADTRANIASGGGAPQVGDLRILEDGGERRGALVSDVVLSETV